MNDRTSNYTINTYSRERLFIALCDIAILIACCTLLAYIYQKEAGWFTALLAIEAIIIVVIRHIGMVFLNKSWLDSFLNRALKKTADLLLSSLFLLTAFPVIYLMSAVYIRCRKGFAHGPILRFKRMRTNAGSFSALLFNESGTIIDRPLINRIPVFFNVIIGDLSLCDFMTLQEDTPEEAQDQICQIAEQTEEDIQEADSLPQDNTYSQVDEPSTEATALPAEPHALSTEANALSTENDNNIQI